MAAAGNILYTESPDVTLTPLVDIGTAGYIAAGVIHRVPIVPLAATPPIVLHFYLRAAYYAADRGCYCSSGSCSSSSASSSQYTPGARASCQHALASSAPAQAPITRGNIREYILNRQPERVWRSTSDYD